MIHRSHWIVCLSAVAYLLWLWKRHRTRVPDASAKPHGADSDTHGDMAGDRDSHRASGPEESMLNREQLTRLYQFYGDASMERIRGARCVIVGLGGVGSHAAVHLLRSGVGMVRLVDFDQVTLSSLNRHAVATRSHVGVAKVVVIRDWARQVVPQSCVEAVVEMVDAQNLERILGVSANSEVQRHFDFILDCIDHVESKVALLACCARYQLPVISSMGSACKSDPSRVRIADLSDTQEDALARAVRSRLRSMGIQTRLPVIYSTERPTQGLPTLTLPDCGAADDFAPLPGFRVRTLPVLGPLPAIFGASMASFVLCRLAQFPMEPLPCRPLKSTAANKWLADFQSRNTEEPCFLTVSDVQNLADEVWHNKSSISGQVNKKLFLAKWVPGIPALPTNLVLLTREELNAHSGPESCTETIRTRIKDRLHWSQLVVFPHLPSGDDGRCGKSMRP